MRIANDTYHYLHLQSPALCLQKKPAKTHPYTHDDIVSKTRRMHNIVGRALASVHAEHGAVACVTRM